MKQLCWQSSFHCCLPSTTDRLTFSVSPSDDERQTGRSGDKVLTAQKQITSQRTLTLPTNEPANPDPPEFSERESGTDEARTEASGRFLLSQNTTNMSFNPKKTSTQVRGGAKQEGVVKERASAAARRRRRTLARDPDSEEEEAEEDPELMTLLEPSARVSRLVGLSQLGRHSSKKTTGARESSRGSERDTTDDEATAIVRGDSRGTTVSEPKRKSAIRPPTTRTKTSAATSLLKKTAKSSRKSVAFNPHTTNLGSPEELPPVAGRRGRSPESDRSGGGIYDYVPSDEEDYAHNKSRLYSPRKKSILGRTAGSGKRRSPHKERRHSGGVEEKGEESRTGSSGEEMRRQKVGGEGDESGSVRGEFRGSDISGVSSKAKGNTRKVSSKGKELSSKVAKDSNRVDEVSNDNVSSGSQWFVPDDLSLHAMISDKSPRSLQRLTRTGRKSQTVTADDPSTPQRRRKEKRKPRELDSTADTRLEDGGSERENESGSLSGGTSSADEVGTSGTSKRQQKTKEATNVRTASGGKNTGRKKSTKSKVTTPWQSQQKKRVTPPSNEVHTDEEGEGEEVGTPASKKQRVSTVEEDEGMQSGDGLSLSSSEEGEPSQDLVRSLGGRRYRRHTVEYQNPKTPGVRRSKRTRIAPIQTWNNEEPEYERRRSGKPTSILSWRQKPFMNHIKPIFINIVAWLALHPKKLEYKVWFISAVCV